MTVLLMHCGQCGSRRQLGRELTGGRLASNIWRMVGKAHYHIACHPDTVNEVLEALDPEQEFIENPDGPYNKQDCELKAWRRLIDKIAKTFPRLQLNLTGDGLYAEATGMADLDARGWNFTITLSEDKLPSVTAQLPPAVARWTGHKTDNKREPDKNGKLHGIRRTVRWRTPITYHGEIYHVLEMEDHNEQGERVYYNRWITNVKPDRTNAFGLAQVGRLRWKIENQGTNTQKNGGYEMEHVYGRKAHAWKNYYLLLQISQLLNDLLRFGNLIAKVARSPEATFAQMYGTIRNFARRLLEALRIGSPDMNGPPGLANIRIRLGTS
jgi:hypothetical protein